MNKKAWYECCGPKATVVVSSRVRLARNLKGTAFPNKLSIPDQRQVNERIKKTFFASNDHMKELYLAVDLANLSQVEQELLVEKRLISPALMQAAHPVEALIRKDEAVSVMLGEEDHIRIQAMRAGLDLEKAYEEAAQVALLLEEQLPIAYDEKVGFLTACPTNTGTGLRASVMMHLPALTELKQINNLKTQLAQLGMTIRGAMGEGTKGSFKLYQISNQITLGLSEEDLILDLKKAADQTIQLEENARKELLTHKRLYLEDRIYRSRAALESARLLGQNEAEELLSDLRWGVELGLFQDLCLEDVTSLISACGRAQVQRKAGQTLAAEKRDELRARQIREVLQKIKSKNET